MTEGWGAPFKKDWYGLLNGPLVRPARAVH